MLFTSWDFLFFFLPIALFGYWTLSHLGRAGGASWLILASIVFYGFFAPSLVILLLCSIAFNYLVSVGIRSLMAKPSLQQALLFFGITADLGALFYYKYFFALFSFVDGLAFNGLHGMQAIILPLGISFFTFTQIGYLIDCKAGVTEENSLLDYILFVTFFPHLIAGPILHHSEMMPQFADRSIYGLRADNLGAGFSFFTLGMLKKILFADPLAALNASGFAAAEHIQVLGAWGTVLGYSLQLYFDFSGYSDMAIGLALMFNIKFPANFNSPYKARNIIDFWQRWHMTLTRYLTLYLYNPIAMGLRRRRMDRGHSMSRKAMETPHAFVTLVAMPTVFTMGLAGLWHGAGFQFVIFGLLHGFYLVVNHGWRMYGPKPSKTPRAWLARQAIVVSQVTITFLAVLLAQVFFRADSTSQALDMLSGMFGLHGFEHALPVPRTVMNVSTKLNALLQPFGFSLFVPVFNPYAVQAFRIVLGFVIVWSLPNTQQIMALAKPILGKMPPMAPRLLLWRPSVPWALTIGGSAIVALLSLSGTTEFLYFQF